MKIAVVGGGVSGLYAAWQLSKRHDVILFEADTRLGGHADTHFIDEPDGGVVAVDSGFIVFNEQHYPLFSAWLDALGVSGQDSDMSFAVSDRTSGLEYNATRLGTLFCQRRNLFSPRFLGMVRDILRFYRRAPALLAALDDRVTLGDWLADSGLGEMFAEQHLLPMASALWSAPMGKVGDFPMRHLLAFMENHAMLQISGRPRWRTVSGGSQRYVEKARECSASFELGTPVRSIRRDTESVHLATDSAELRVDTVIIACHADQALGLLGDPSDHERSVLSAIPYQANETLLHLDSSVLPQLPAARASWNVRRDSTDREQCRVSYYMNLLQGIDSPRDYIVSLNQAELIDPAKVLVRRRYRHPVFTPEAVLAQRRWSDINGIRRTWYCGAWWGWGFHEDGVRSAQRVLDQLEPQLG